MSYGRNEKMTHEDEELLRRLWPHLYGSGFYSIGLDEYGIRSIRKNYEGLCSINGNELVTWAWQGSVYLLDSYELPQADSIEVLVEALDSQLAEWDEEVEGTDEEPAGDREAWAAARRWLLAGPFAHWLLANYVEEWVIDAVRDGLLGLLNRENLGLDQIAEKRWEQFMAAWSKMDEAEQQEKAA